MCLKDKNNGPAAKRSEIAKIQAISEGYKYLRILRLDKSISCFEAVLIQDPNNIKSLLGRAKCFMRLGRYQEAQLDLQQIVKMNPKCTEAIYLKGVTEYMKGNFEKAFFAYWDGHQLLPGQNQLRQGYGMCETAIENNLGANAGLVIKQKDIDKIHRRWEEFQTTEEDTQDIEDYSKKGLFSADLKLLRDMLEDRSLAQHHPLCKDLFNYMRERQKFWRMQNPGRIRNTVKSFTSMKKKASDLTTANRLIRNTTLCKMYLAKGKTKNCIKKGIEALDILKSVPSEQFREKDETEAEILHNLAKAYLIDKDFDSSLKYCEQQLDVAKNSKVHEDQERALQDLGEVYMEKKSYRTALEFFTECLQLVEKEYSRIMLLYKISDCNIHLNRLEKARCIANQCLEFASRTENVRFHSDVLLLLAEIAIKGKELKEAEQFYKKAIEIAIKEKDPREKDLRMLLKLLEAIDSKDSCSDERINILRMSNQMKT